MSAIPLPAPSSLGRMAVAGILYLVECAVFVVLTPAAIFASAVSLLYGAIEDLTQGAVAKLGALVSREQVPA